jgi:hypothetical protein
MSTPLNRIPVTLGARFTLLVSIVFVIGLVLSYFALSWVLTNRAQNEVSNKSLVLVGLMNSVRNYTTLHVAPLLDSALNQSETFIPETVPAYSAREVFENLRKTPDYANFLYKEATLNPTNPRDLADPFEADLVGQFRAVPTLKELTGYRTLNGVQTFYTARPFAIRDPNCLACHDTPQRAPASLIRTYGSERGFGWKLDEIIATQIIYIPAEDVFSAARNSLSAMLLIFVVVFLTILVLVRVQLQRSIVNPLALMGKIANRVGSNEMSFNDAERAEIKRIAARPDEIGQTSRALDSMTQAVKTREETLTKQVQQLRIEVDQARKAKQVAEITETDYFHDLQSKARAIRKRPTT